MKKKQGDCGFFVLLITSQCCCHYAAKNGEQAMLSLAGGYIKNKREKLMRSLVRAA
jgi:hypothetical protein